MAPIKGGSIADNPCAACAVRDISVCGALDAKDVARLNAIVTHQRLGAGETLFIEGDDADNLYTITDGCVKLYKMMIDGRRQITGFLYRSDFLGLAMRDSYAYSVEAVSACDLCRFPRGKLERLLDEFPRMERRLLSIASNELASAQDQMLLLGRKTAEEKVASFLWLLRHRAQVKIGMKVEMDADRIDLPMTRTDIADFLGLTIETVSRSFSALKKRGVIAFDNPHRIEIADPAGLMELAGIDEVPEIASAIAYR
jgi:CRP/FNR family transcriptional regulator